MDLLIYLTAWGLLGLTLGKLARLAAWGLL